MYAVNNILCYCDCSARGAREYEVEWCGIQFCLNIYGTMEHTDRVYSFLHSFKFIQFVCLLKRDGKVGQVEREGRRKQTAISNSTAYMQIVKGRMTEINRYFNRILDH